MSSPSRGLNLFAEKKFGPESVEARKRYALGDVVTTLIQTVGGQTIVVKHDTDSPPALQPGTSTCRGPEAWSASIPRRRSTSRGAPRSTSGNRCPITARTSSTPCGRPWKRQSKGAGHGGMDYIEDYRLIQCLRRGTPLDMDVYDAAALSAVSPAERALHRQPEPTGPFPRFHPRRLEEETALGHCHRLRRQSQTPLRRLFPGELPLPNQWGRRLNHKKHKSHKIRLQSCPISVFVPFVAVRRRAAFCEPGYLNEIGDLPIPAFVPLVAIQARSGPAPRIPCPLSRPVKDLPAEFCKRLTILQLPLKGSMLFLFPCSHREAYTMLAKLTSKNQLTLPKAVVSDFQGSEYFDVTKENGRIVLTPVRLNRADAVRAKLAELGLSEADVSEAVAWARRAK